jgi:hypothetical protein
MIATIAHVRLALGLAAGSAVLTALVLCAAPASGQEWPSSNRYRLLLSVDPRGQARSHSPATVTLDLMRAARDAGASGEVDLDTLEVAAFDDTGRPFVFDAARAPEERHLLPWRLERAYALDRVTLHFVVPNEKLTRFAVFFDVRGSGRGHPERYSGLVGDGDLLVEGYGRREIGPSGYDAMGDLDGDGDLDLLRGGTEPFVQVFENAGGGRFIDRGRLTSHGEVLVLPHDPGHRSWASLTLVDWDGDGDQDLFAHVWAGLQKNEVLRYENVTTPGGLLTFAERGPLSTITGPRIAQPVDFVDWDGDGRLDVLSVVDAVLCFFRNTGDGRAVSEMRLADGEPILANGEPLMLDRPRVSAVDIDADGDLDLLAASDDGRVYLFENAGTRARPALRMGRAIIHYEWMDCRTGLAAADFDGDGLVDILTGRYWERTRFGEQARVRGRLYRNVGSRERPHFEARDARGGAPYTEQVQSVDAMRQSGVVVADWDDDGRRDLIVGDSDGFVSFFRNLSGDRAPFFAPGERLAAGGVPLRVWGEEREGRAAGYARPAVTDWNNDGLKDLLVADGRAWLTLFINEGARGAPRLGTGRRLAVAGKPIDGTARGSAIVCDWDGDGRKDVLFAMSGESAEGSFDWTPVTSEAASDRGVLFYPNKGSDAAPVLDVPRWVRAGSDRWPIDLERPNLGDVADWDGDGLKDLLLCEFENDVRLFRNSAKRGRPRLAGPAEGETLLEPWSREMLSGAQAVDWNGDGDLDILTGQGHGGTGVRFFERDFIDDGLRGTQPKVVVLGAESRPAP